MFNNDTNHKEIDRLAKLYCERRHEFERASRTRWLLTFVGLAIVVSLFLLRVLFLLSDMDMKDILNGGIKPIGVLLLASFMFSGVYIFVNVSLFGWLFQKDIAERRRLDDIVKQIRELEQNSKI